MVVLGASLAAASGYLAGILEFDDASLPVPKSISPASLEAAESDFGSFLKILPILWPIFLKKPSFLS